MTGVADCLVVGAGISGLAAAFRLRRAHPEWRITIAEAGAAPGGALRTWRADGWVLEEGPDSFVRFKPAGLRLVDDLGLRSRLVDTLPGNRRALIARGRRLIPVPEGLYLLAPGRWLPFLASPLLSWPGKLRMGLDLLLPRGPAGDQSLAAFVRRRLGREALERIAQPMVGGIYTADPERLSLAATMPQFLEMERTHRSLLLAMRARTREQAALASGPRYGLFASLEGGLASLAEALVAALADGELRCGFRVAGLRRAEGVWTAEGPAGALAARRLVLALPAHAAAPLLAPIAATLARDLAAIPYASVATVNLGWRIDPDPTPAAAGFVVPAVEGRSLVAATFAQRKYPGRVPPGHINLRAFVGGALQREQYQRDDAAMVDALRRDLADWLPTLGEPCRVRVSRWDRAMAQYEVGHGERVARIRAAEATLPGLALLGNGYEGVGIPDLAQQAEELVRRLG